MSNSKEIVLYTKFLQKVNEKLISKRKEFKNSCNYNNVNKHCKLVSDIAERIYREEFKEERNYRLSTTKIVTACILHDIGKTICKPKDDHALKTVEILQEVIDENKEFNTNNFRDIIYAIKHHSNKKPMKSELEDNLLDSKNALLLILMDADMISKFSLVSLFGRINYLMLDTSNNQITDRVISTYLNDNKKKTENYLGLANSIYATRYFNKIYSLLEEYDFMVRY